MLEEIDTEVGRIIEVMATNQVGAEVKDQVMLIYF